MPLRVGVARARKAYDRRDGAARRRELELHFRQCRERAEGRRGMPHGAFVVLDQRRLEHFEQHGQCVMAVQRDLVLGRVCEQRE